MRGKTICGTRSNRKLVTTIAASLLALIAVTFIPFPDFLMTAVAHAAGRTSSRSASHQVTPRPPEKVKLLAIRKVGDGSTASLEFVLRFNKLPDFRTADSAGRLADSFQFFIAYDPRTKNPANPTVADIILRPETSRAADGVRVRTARPRSTERAAGGWGTLRGSVPYTVNAKGDGSAIVTFTAPCSVLGVGGKFAYALEVYSYGGLVQSVKGVGPTGEATAEM